MRRVNKDVGVETVTYLGDELWTQPTLWSNAPGTFRICSLYDPSLPPMILHKIDSKARFDISIIDSAGRMWTKIDTTLKRVPMRVESKYTLVINALNSFNTVEP
jgi:hypothetical protein